MELTDLSKVFSLVLVDLALSGDNAVVIGLAARNLPPQLRSRVILFGAGAAIVLRIIFAALATLLLQVPFLHLVGGLVLIWIAYRLLLPEDEEKEVPPAESVMQALRFIIIADLTMSLDNVLALAGVADGNIYLLGLGLALSMPPIIIGGGLMSTVFHRLPFLAYLGSAVLGWTAGSMILEEPFIHSFLQQYVPHESIQWVSWVFSGLLAIFVPFLAYLKARSMTAAHLARAQHS